MWFNLEKLKMDAFTASMLLFFVSSVFAAYQLNMILLLEAELRYRRERLRMYLEYLNSSGLIVRCRVRKPRAPRRFWVKPGRTRSWWDSFVSNIVPPEENHSHRSQDYRRIVLRTVKRYTRKAIFVTIFLNSVLV